jgi:metal-responsive CopG/Arc/MetJ family transcriptional regulator
MSSQTQSPPITGNLYAKCLCISFPGHELRLIDDLDALAKSERISRSLYIRRIIRQQMDRRRTIGTTAGTINDHHS